MYFFICLSKIQVTEPQQPCLKHNTRQPERNTFLFHFRNCVAINILAITYIWAASHVIILYNKTKLKRNALSKMIPSDLLSGLIGIWQNTDGICESAPISMATAAVSNRQTDCRTEEGRHKDNTIAIHCFETLVHPILKIKQERWHPYSWN